MVALIIATLTALLMIASVIFKPNVKVFKIKIGLYTVICVIGALFTLLFSGLSLFEVGTGLISNSAINPIKILILFISMTLMSIYLGDSGFFNYVADKVLIKSKGGLLKLFLSLYFVVAILTIFTSNDIVILTFTPPICIFAKKLKISPIPFLFGEFVAANTWSMALIIGNPTNVYLASANNISFIQYLSVMIVPTIVGGLVSLGVLLFVFRKTFFAKKHSILQFKKDYESNSDAYVRLNKPVMSICLIHLSICIVFLTISSYVGLEMWLICLILALSLTIFVTIYGVIKEKSLFRVTCGIKKAPYELIFFVISMYIIVLGLAKNGWTNTISTILISGKNIDGVSIGFVSAISSNLLNNIPMSILFESIVSGKGIASVYGAIIGSNIGAYITPVGALAGIMWNNILSNYGVKFSFAKFILYGIIVAIPTLLATTLTLLIFV